MKAHAGREAFSLILMLLPAYLAASSIPGHIYSATRMVASCPELAAAIRDQQAAFHCGAAGPDITFAACNPEDRTSAGAESHYERTGELCLSFLREAQTPAERAFALGWVSHWMTDVYIHTLVNAYGGCWDQPGQRHRHSELEVVEAKHVYSIRQAVPGLGELTIAASEVPSSFITRAFGATYAKPAYKPRVEGQPGSAPFATLLTTAAALSRAALATTRKPARAARARARTRSQPWSSEPSWQRCPPRNNTRTCCVR